jgi:hypothetical protein
MVREDMNWIQSSAMTFCSVVETELFQKNNPVKHNYFYYINNSNYNMA